MLDSESETFVVHVISFNSNMLPCFSPLRLNIYLSQRPQISGLITGKTLTKIPTKYLDFADILSLDLASILYEYTGINTYPIKLFKGQ